MSILQQATCIILLFFTQLVSCGGPIVKTSAPGIKYYLERMNTNKTENYLIIEAEAGSNYAFKISGTGFASEIDLNTLTPVRDRTRLTYNDEDTYVLTLELTTADGFTFVQETLAWEYSTEVPPQPIVTFSEKATSDTSVILILGSTLGSSTTEIWVEGDLEGSKAEGSWTTIASNLQVPLVTSAPDGVKTFSIKYRNIFGSESKAITAQILKKTKGPTACSAVATGNKTPHPAVRLHLAATNDGELFYTVVGDLAKPLPFTAFTQSVDPTIELSSGAGVKNLTVKIRDLAGNYCPDLPISLTLDPTYVRYGTIIENEPLWTNNRFINLINRFDYLPSDTPEIYISGGVIDDAYTHEWIPYQEVIPVELSPLEGNRYIYTRFRYRGTTTEGDILATRTYLRPSVAVSSGGSPRAVTVSRILDMLSLSIDGCAESYQNVDYASSYACTPTGSSVSVTYFLTDGTSLTRSASVL